MLVFVGATGFLKPVRRASLALYFRVQRPTTEGVDACWWLGVPAPLWAPF